MCSKIWCWRRYLGFRVTKYQRNGGNCTVRSFNTLRTGDADLRFYVTTVQDGWRRFAFLTRWNSVHLQVLLSATPQGGMFPEVSHPQTLLGSLVSISWKFQFTKIVSEFVINFKKTQYKSWLTLRLLMPLASWYRGFEFHLGHGYLSVVSVVCCQVEVSATSWSLVHSSPTDCAASLCVI